NEILQRSSSLQSRLPLPFHQDKRATTASPWCCWPHRTTTVVSTVLPSRVHAPIVVGNASATAHVRPARLDPQVAGGGQNARGPAAAGRAPRRHDRARRAGAHGSRTHPAARGVASGCDPVLHGRRRGERTALRGADGAADRL